MHRFYAPPEAIAAGFVLLDEGETRHLRDVLRLGRGETVSVFDGAGHEFLCRVAEMSKRVCKLTIIETVEPASPESDLDLTFAAAMLKSEKFDLVVQKSVELGVKRLIPLQTLRSDVKLKQTSGRLDRWRRIALEATKQSGRAVLMRVDPPTAFDALLSGLRPTDEAALLFAERDGRSLPETLESKKMIAVIGPEGGWDDSELEAARSKNIPIITLGGRVLRAETATIAIAAILQHRFGDVN
jgi:16S rRNA (uracil1498-N3)-methyltransferase